MGILSKLFGGNSESPQKSDGVRVTLDRTWLNACKQQLLERAFATPDPRSQASSLLVLHKMIEDIVYSATPQFRSMPGRPRLPDPQGPEIVVGASATSLDEYGVMPAASLTAENVVEATKQAAAELTRRGNPRAVIPILYVISAVRQELDPQE